MKKRVKLMKKFFKGRKGKDVVAANDFIAKDLEKALLRANLLLAVENEVVSKPIIIKSSNTDNSNVKFKLIKIDKETERVVYSESVVTTLLLGKTSLFFHEAVVNHIHGYVVEDYASELKYRDIVHLETYVDYDHRVDHIGISSVHLLVHLINGTTLALNLRTHYMHSKVDYPELLTNEERAIINNIKNAVRAVK